jgi:hypothetical protein
VSVSHENARLVQLASLALFGSACFTDDAIARLRATSPDSSVADVAAEDVALGEVASNDATSDEVSARCSNDDILDPGTVALYDFEGTIDATVADRTGRHPGSVRGGAAMLEPGPLGCGSALTIRDQFYVYVPDSPDWVIAEGSVDFWVRLPAVLPQVTMAVLSRDAHYTTDGEITVYIDTDGTIVGRLQRGNATAVRCSTRPAQPGKWTKVGFNFGPSGTALYVDGELGTGARFLNFIMGSCGTDANGGLNANGYPLVIGASLDRADDARTDELTFFLVGGAVDDVRISNVQRVF